MSNSQSDLHPAAEAAATADESVRLGKLIYRTRQRTGTLQRVVSKRSGIAQPRLSAYEQGRVQPSWSTFVLVMSAMDQRPVIQIDPAPPPTPLDYLLGCLNRAVREVLTVLEGRPYRFERDVAAQLLGRQSVPDVVRVCAEGDVDELAQRVLDLDREVITQRSGSQRSGSQRTRVQFEVAALFVSIELVEKVEPGIQVLHDGQIVEVAPWADIDAFRP